MCVCVGGVFCAFLLRVWIHAATTTATIPNYSVTAEALHAAPAELCPLLHLCVLRFQKCPVHQHPFYKRVNEFP